MFNHKLKLKLLANSPIVFSMLNAMSEPVRKESVSEMDEDYSFQDWYQEIKCERFMFYEEWKDYLK